MGKQKILFLGGFSVGKDGTEGGQVYACRSLVASPISEEVEWILVDSTQRSLPPPYIVVRAFDAAIRLFKCTGHLVFSRVDVVLVFSGFAPLSICEKGLVCVLGKVSRKRVVLSFRAQPRVPRRCSRAYAAWVRLVCGACDTVVCQTEFAASEIRRLFGFSSSSVAVVHNWIDNSRYGAPKRGEKKDKCVEESDVVRLIYVGWLHANKGVQFLLPALRKLSDAGKNVHLTMCGGGELYGELVSQSRDLGIGSMVDFRGWVKNDEVVELLRGSDVFVFPTFSEGMSNALLQAMACGLPVVTTDVASNSEVVCDGVNGVIIEPGSVDAICKGLIKLIESPHLRCKMATNNLKEMERYDVKNVWPRVARVLGVHTDRERC